MRRLACVRTRLVVPACGEARHALPGHCLRAARLEYARPGQCARALGKACAWSGLCARALGKACARPGTCVLAEQFLMGSEVDNFPKF